MYKQLEGELALRYFSEPVPRLWEEPRQALGRALQAEVGGLS